MRAPPVAVKQTNGTFCSSAACTPRTKRSPTTEPIEPPMKSNSNAATTTGTLITAPCITTSASVSSVFFLASFRRSEYFVLSLNLSVSTGSTSGRSRSGPRRRGRRRAARAPSAVVMAALGADVQVLLQVGLVEHRLARGALDPQALRHLALGRRSAGSSAAAVFRASSCCAPSGRLSSAARISAMKARAGENGIVACFGFPESG